MGDAENHAVDFAVFLADFCTYFTQLLQVFARGEECDGVGVAAAVALDTDTADGEHLPLQLITPRYILLYAGGGGGLGGYAAEDAYTEAGTGEGVAVDEGIGESEFASDFAHFVLVEFAQWLYDESGFDHFFDFRDAVVVGLDLIGVFGAAALYGIGIDSPLAEQPMLGIEFESREGLPLDGKEDATNDAALLFGVGGCLKRGEEVGGFVGYVRLLESCGDKTLGYFGGFIAPHESVIHQHAKDTLRAQCLLEEGEGDTAIYTARDKHEYLLGFAYVLLNAGDLFLQEGVHVPGFLSFGKGDKMLEEILPDVGVSDFGVELGGKYGELGMGGSGDLTVFGRSYDFEILRELGDFVAVTHPDGAFLGEALVDTGLASESEGGRTEFGGFGFIYFPTEEVRYELMTVADGEDGDA